MCQECENYSYLPPMMIGGPTGDYFVECPTQSCRWAEYAVISAHCDTSCDVVINGDSPPAKLTFDGSVTLNGDAYAPVITLGLSGLQAVTMDADVFYRVTNSQKRLFIRIDTAQGSHAAFVSIRFRVRLLTVVPGPSLTVHPDNAEQIHFAREEKTRQRLAAAGIPGYALEEQK